MPALDERQRSRLAAVPASERRVAALALPTLLVELAEQSRAQARSRLPLAVVLVEESSKESPFEEVLATSLLSAVNEVARRLGVREGQTVAEARAFSAHLVVHAVPRSALEQALGNIAEIALGFGPVAAFSAPDTVWVDISGIAHLFGGEAGLAAELVGRVREAGHRARVAVASGPLLSQAFARFGELDPEGCCLVASHATRDKLGRLPVRALNLPLELERWFLRLGVLTIADLAKLPHSALALRLGEHAQRTLELVQGRDPTPLRSYEPPRVLSEETTWEEPLDGQEPLLFVLRGLVARISARLRGRGEAAQALVLRILADPVVARFRGVPRETTLEFALPKPLHRADELGRIVASRLERLALAAPSIGLRLEVVKLSEPMPRQLELGSLLMGAKSDAWDELPVILAELGADIGEKHLGVLRVVDSHRPERTSELVPALKRQEKLPVKKARAEPRPMNGTQTMAGLPTTLRRMTRLLPEPVPFEAPLRAGSSVVFEHRAYVIESVHFEHRLEAVEWWNKAINRDYVRVALRGAKGVFEALVYVDRETGKRYAQGFFD